MKVVLRQDVDNLGDRGQVVNVAPGYARNFLLPKGLALEATAGNLRTLELQRKVWEKREAKEADGARQLAARIAERWRPDVVVGIAKGGVFVGGALSATLGTEFVPVRVERRSRDVEPVGSAGAELPDLKGKRVLVVDDVANSGNTLEKGRALARKRGARDVRTAVLVVRPGGFSPDWHAVETDALVLFGWDYQLDAGGGPVDPGEVGV